MGSEMQPCNKNLKFSAKKFTFGSFYMEQLFSKLILKYVISFKNRKSSCGYNMRVFKFYNIMSKRYIPSSYI
jgi:hypothetical protein